MAAMCIVQSLCEFGHLGLETKVCLECRRRQGTEDNFNVKELVERVR